MAGIKRTPGSQFNRRHASSGVTTPSSDPKVEGTFNRLKNEFGITVDALSWMPPRENQWLEGNYLQGYLQAPEAATRYVALLYESTISLSRLGNRIDFLSDEVRGRLVEDFGLMGRFFAEVRDNSPARIFTLDGRPVVFLFGSHSWGFSPQEFEF